LKNLKMIALGAVLGTCVVQVKAQGTPAYQWPQPIPDLISAKHNQSKPPKLVFNVFGSVVGISFDGKQWFSPLASMSAGVARKLRPVPLKNGNLLQPGLGLALASPFFRWAPVK
jgi:hypothetical protein